MTTFEKVRAACSSVNLPSYPDFNTNNEETFVVYNMEAESPKLHGDDTPHAMVADVQIHLYLPAETNFFSIKKSLADALFGQGLTYPYTDLNTIENGTIRHIVLSCEDDEDDFTV